MLERTVRKGDLRASILAVLKWDTRQPFSETGLAKHLRASRLAVRKSLDALAIEGHALRQREDGARNWVIG